MMKTIILPGYSLHNKAWADEIKESLDLGHEVIINEWLHWQGKGSLTFKNEGPRILQKIGEDKVNFIAKSVGTRILAQILPEIKDKVLKVILCGIPYRGFKEETKRMFKEAFSPFDKEKIVCFQNKSDPFGPFKAVREFIFSISPEIVVYEGERSDHNYPFPNEFESFLK